jgi:hypothetical protein
MEDEVDDEETRDIMGDYPDLYKRLEKEELGYRKGLFYRQDNGVKGKRPRMCLKWPIHFLFS